MRAISKAKKAALLIVSVAALLTCSAATARGAPRFNPNPNNNVRAVVVQPDGKILIAGEFTTLSPNGVTVTRNHIARLNPNGTLDIVFDPNVTGDGVYVIALQADGKILVGGQFTGVSGQTRHNIARLDATTGFADSFNPNANANENVLSIAVQADGKILVGGGFRSSNGANSIGGQPRNRIARLDATTGLADSFDPNADNFVRSMALQADGKILVGGDFSLIGGHPRYFIARLDPATGLADSFDPHADNAIFTIAVQADGKVLTGGAFTTIGGQSRSYLARLDAATGASDSFNPKANFYVYAIAVQANGKVLVGGDFNAFHGTNTIGGQLRNYIARLDAATGLADSFDPKPDYWVDAIAVQPDGKILMGGNFTISPPAGDLTMTRNRIARLEMDGSLDQTLGKRRGR